MNHYVFKDFSEAFYNLGKHLYSTGVSNENGEKIAPANYVLTVKNPQLTYESDTFKLKKNLDTKIPSSAKWEKAIEEFKKLPNAIYNYLNVTSDFKIFTYENDVCITVIYRDPLQLNYSTRYKFIEWFNCLKKVYTELYTVNDQFKLGTITIFLTEGVKITKDDASEIGAVMDEYNQQLIQLVTL